MGCSNPHPHGQIWAEELLPDIACTELKRQEDYYITHGKSMLAEYLRYELQHKERIICSNHAWTALVPYWAVWPFEALVIPVRDVPSLDALTEDEKFLLAEILNRLCIRYDNLFSTDFPYSMGIHQAPVNRPGFRGTTLHLHYFPPLLRSADVKKFMVGYEMLAMPQRDLTPEESAARLSALPELHYSLH